MKRFTGRDGSQRLWFEPDEIDEITEGELQKAGLFPTPENPVVDVEQFIEFHLKAQLDQYAQLDRTVLGVTEFRAGTQPVVRINKDLTGSALDEEGSPPYVVGRWRATLAHEAAHVILHRRLFNLNPGQTPLFEIDDDDAPSASRLLRCLKRDVLFGSSSGDWREIQANMGMAAILMPRLVFGQVFQLEISAASSAQGRIERNSPEARSVASKIAARFQVSRQAAAIRLETLNLLLAPGQFGLL